MACQKNLERVGRLCPEDIDNSEIPIYLLEKALEISKNE